MKILKIPFSGETGFLFESGFINRLLTPLRTGIAGSGLHVIYNFAVSRASLNTFAMVTVEFVKKTFAPLEEGDPPSFFTHVADDVSWTITGNEDPLSGHYTSKVDVITKTMKRMTACLTAPVERRVTNVLTCGDWAVVEHTASTTTKKGSAFNQKFCWVCRYEGDKIVEVRMYQDSALSKMVLEENE